MSLPTREVRALNEIEGGLLGGAPRLVSMFAIFTRLTIDDGAPRTETLQQVALARRLWRRSRVAAEVLIAIPLTLGLVALIAFLAVSSAGVHSCRPDAGAPYVTAGNPVLACQSAHAGQKPAVQNP